MNEFEAFRLVWIISFFCGLLPAYFPASGGEPSVSNLQQDVIFNFTLVCVQLYSAYSLAAGHWLMDLIQISNSVNLFVIAMLSAQTSCLIFMLNTGVTGTEQSTSSVVLLEVPKYFCAIVAGGLSLLSFWQLLCYIPPLFVSRSLADRFRRLHRQL